MPKIQTCTKILNSGGWWEYLEELTELSMVPFFSQWRIKVIYYSPDTYFNFANRTVNYSQVVIYILSPLIQHSNSYLVQLTFKQHGLNWIGPLVHGFFFSRNYYSIPWSMVGWIHGYGTEGAELWIWRADYKLEGDFQLCWWGWVGP